MVEENSVRQTLWDALCIYNDRAGFTISADRLFDFILCNDLSSRRFGSDRVRRFPCI